MCLLVIFSFLIFFVGRVVVVLFLCGSSGFCSSRGSGGMGGIGGVGMVNGVGGVGRVGSLLVWMMCSLWWCFGVFVLGVGGIIRFCLMMMFGLLVIVWVCMCLVFVFWVCLVMWVFYFF